jgi:hypothetical protein
MMTFISADDVLNNLARTVLDARPKKIAVIASHRVL